MTVPLAALVGPCLVGVGRGGSRVVVGVGLGLDAGRRTTEQAEQRAARSAAAERALTSLAPLRARPLALRTKPESMLPLT